MKKKLRVKNFFKKKDLETPETPKKRIKIRSTETILQNRFAPAQCAQVWHKLKLAKSQIPIYCAQFGNKLSEF